MTSEERLERVETHSAHLELEISHLSETVKSQWEEIERLKREVGKLTRTLEAMLAEQDGEEAPIQKPPHY